MSILKAAKRWPWLTIFCVMILSFRTWDCLLFASVTQINYVQASNEYVSRLFNPNNSSGLSAALKHYQKTKDKTELRIAYEQLGSNLTGYAKRRLGRGYTAKSIKDLSQYQSVDEAILEAFKLAPKVVQDLREKTAKELERKYRYGSQSDTLKRFLAYLPTPTGSQVIRGRLNKLLSRYEKRPYGEERHEMIYYADLYFKYGHHASTIEHEKFSKSFWKFIQKKRLKHELAFLGHEEIGLSVKSLGIIINANGVDKNNVLGPFLAEEISFDKSEFPHLNIRKVNIGVNKTLPDDDDIQLRKQPRMDGDIQAEVLCLSAKHSVCLAETDLHFFSLIKLDEYGLVHIFARKNARVLHYTLDPAAYEEVDEFDRADVFVHSVEEIGQLEMEEGAVDEAYLEGEWITDKIFYFKPISYFRINSSTGTSRYSNLVQAVLDNIDQKEITSLSKIDNLLYKFEPHFNSNEDQKMVKIALIGSYLQGRLMPYKNPDLKQVQSEEFVKDFKHIADVLTRIPSSYPIYLDIVRQLKQLVSYLRDHHKQTHPIVLEIFKESPNRKKNIFSTRALLIEYYYYPLREQADAYIEDIFFVLNTKLNFPDGYLPNKGHISNLAHHFLKRLPLMLKKKDSNLDHRVVLKHLPDEWDMRAELVHSLPYISSKEKIIEVLESDIGNLLSPWNTTLYNFDYFSRTLQSLSSEGLMSPKLENLLVEYVKDCGRKRDIFRISNIFRILISNVKNLNDMKEKAELYACVSQAHPRDIQGLAMSVGKTYATPLKEILIKTLEGKVSYPLVLAKRAVSHKEWSQTTAYQVLTSAAIQSPSIGRYMVDLFKEYYKDAIQRFSIFLETQTIEVVEATLKWIPLSDPPLVLNPSRTSDYYPAIIAKTHGDKAIPSLRRLAGKGVVAYRDRIVDEFKLKPQDFDQILASGKIPEEWERAIYPIKMLAALSLLEITQKPSEVETNILTNIPEPSYTAVTKSIKANYYLLLTKYMQLKKPSGFDELMTDLNRFKPLSELAMEGFLENFESFHQVFSKKVDWNTVPRVTKVVKLLNEKFVSQDLNMYRTTYLKKMMEVASKDAYPYVLDYLFDYRFKPYGVENAVSVYQAAKLVYRGDKNKIGELDENFVGDFERRLHLQYSPDARDNCEALNVENALKIVKMGVKSPSLGRWLIKLITQNEVHIESLSSNPRKEILQLVIEYKENLQISALELVKAYSYLSFESDFVMYSRLLKSLNEIDRDKLSDVLEDDKLTLHPDDRHIIARILWGGSSREQSKKSMRYFQSILAKNKTPIKSYTNLYFLGLTLLSHESADARTIIDFVGELHVFNRDVNELLDLQHAKLVEEIQSLRTKNSRLTQAEMLVRDFLVRKGYLKEY